jgi:hypothetical protein
MKSFLQERILNLKKKEKKIIVLCMIMYKIRIKSSLSQTDTRAHYNNKK